MAETYVQGLNKQLTWLREQLEAERRWRKRAAFLFTDLQKWNTLGRAHTRSLFAITEDIRELLGDQPFTQDEEADQEHG